MPRDSTYIDGFRREVTTLAGELARRWRCEVVAECRLGGRELQPSLTAALLAVIEEAVSNAVRHGRARRVRVLAQTSRAGLEISIADDGCGLAWRGCFAASDLAALDLGPVGLLRRIESLGADATVESNEAGLVLRIRAPEAHGPSVAAVFQD